MIWSMHCYSTKNTVFAYCLDTGRQKQSHGGVYQKAMLKTLTKVLKKIPAPVWASTVRTAIL